MLPAIVTEKLAALPVQSGVYLFKDKKGTVVYVGKAKSLRSRVRSYFQAGGSDNRYFIPILQRTIGDFDTIVTGSEKEAMILENNLIKEHHPRYNIKLRDDKDYLSIRLATFHPWPRLDVVRRPSVDELKKGARFFGPYHSATAARRTLHLINKHFQLRTCTDLELVSRKRPCLQHQIKRCPAPCVYEVDRAWYAEQVRTVQMFLEGRHDELSRELDTRMKESARAMRFELAAVYRDQLRALEKVRQSQRVVTVDDTDQDVLGLYREGDLVELALLHIRHGKLHDVGTFSIKNAEIPDEEIVAAFLAQHYGQAGIADDEPEAAATTVLMPEEIVMPCLPETHAGIAEWLGDKAGHKVVLVHPKRGARVGLVAMANDNARHSFVEKRRTSDDVAERLAQLQERLRLPTVPHRIECCDISHLGGGDTVGAVVAMLDGLPDKKRYRTFNVRGTSSPQPGVGDDYGAMYEVLARRFRRGRDTSPSEVDNPNASDANANANAGDANAGDARAGDANADAPRDGEPSAAGDASVAPRRVRRGASDAKPRAAGEDWDLPDLFVVDGGRGQLAVALAAARDLGLHALPIVALAKEKEITPGVNGAPGESVVDRVYLPGQKNPIPLKTHSASLFFLARLRDEAHRFSNRARERIGKAKRFRSALDDVKGIGPATKKSLLRTLGTLAAIQKADEATLLAVPGVTRRHVVALRAAFPLSPSSSSSSPDTTEPVPSNSDARAGDAH